MITKIELIHCKCEKCEYEWNPINGVPPKVCPKCKSHNWNVKREVKCQTI